jgi:diketogulonate reductase-like aldo/keto reductase
VTEIARRVTQDAGAGPPALVSQKGVVPIPKANRMDHARENLDVFDFDARAGGWRGSTRSTRTGRRWVAS